METARDNDTTGRDLVAEGRTEAARLQRQVVESMHPQLKPLANRVLEVGLEVKRATVSVRCFRRREEDRRRGRREGAAGKLRYFAAGLAKRFLGEGPSNTSWANYDAGSIEAAFTEYRSIMQNFSDAGIEKTISLSEEGKRFQEVMETRYIDAIIALDDKSEQLGELRAPWDLRYFATAELDAETGKMVVTMPFDVACAGDEIDMCANCNVMFKAREVRVRCFECRNITTCKVCSDVATRLLNTLQKSEPPSQASGDDGLSADNNNSMQQRRMGWEAARKELETCCPHLQHLSAEEEDLLCELRHKAMKGPKNKPKEQKMSLRRLLPRFFTISYANRPCFGVPLHGVDTKEPSAMDALTLKHIPYQWFTYKTVWRTIALLAVELVRILPTPPPSHVKSEDSPDEGSPTQKPVFGPEIGIFSSPGPVFFTCELACVAAGRVPVATDTAWRTGDALSALAAAGVTTLLLDPAGFRAMTAAGAALPPAVRNIVVLATDPFNESISDGNIPCEQLKVWSLVGVQVDFVFPARHKWNDASQGDAAIAKLETYTASNVDMPGDKYVLGIFSSGTSESGGRKGVLLREEVFRKEQTKPYLGHPLVAPLMYSPTWGTGKGIVWTSLCSGGRVGFAIPRLPGFRLWDYLHSIQPTWCVSLVPALMTLLLEEHAAVLARERLEAKNDGFVSWDVRKMEALAHARAAEHLYSCLGSVVEVISTGGAMVNQAHVEQMSRILPCRVVQNYGSTEGGGLGEGKHGRPEMKPVKGLKFRIEDRPEIGYTTTDRPHPRGELLIKSDFSSRAEDWFGSKDAVSIQEQKYTPDGYYKTGDIVELLSDTNTFRIIDRVSLLVKLPCGIFFSPFQVETTVGSLREYGVTDHIVAVTPQGNVSLILEMAVSATKLSSEDASRILAEAQRRCWHAGLDQRFMPSHLVADSGVEDLSIGDSADDSLWKAAGCYTASGKLIRYRVLKRCDVASQMASIDRGKTYALPRISVKGEEGIAENLAVALLESVGLCSVRGGDNEITSLLTTPLAALGVDSLLWAKLSSVMRQTLAQRWQLISSVPHFDLSKRSALYLASWMIEVAKQNGAQAEDRVAQQESNGKDRVLPNTADDTKYLGHSKESSTSCEGTVNDDSVGIDSDDIKGEFKKYLSDLDLLENELFKQAASIDTIQCDQISSSKMPESSECTVLLTGATGFLGRHILAALMEDTPDSFNSNASDQNVTKRKVKVICLVRGPSYEEACHRLVEGFPKKIRRHFSPEALSKIRKEEPFFKVCSDWPQVRVVLGDVAQTRLGLPKDAYQKLVSDVDVIIHAAAVVKMLGRKTELGNRHDMIYSNAMSCVHIAQLAAHAVATQVVGLGHQHPIPVVYVSTKSVERDGLPPGTIVEHCSEAFTTLDLRHDPYSLSKLLGETVLIHGSRANKYSLVILRPGFLTFSSDGNANDKDWLVRLLLTISELGIAPTGGQAVFLEKHTAYKPVDEYARQVVHAAIASTATSNTESEITWPTLCDDYESFRVKDVIDALEFVHHVPPYAFAAAVKSAKYPPPFFPLVDWLFDGDSYERQQRSTKFSSTVTFSTDVELDQKAIASGQDCIPQTLFKGLCAFIGNRCPGLSILNYQ